MAPARLRREASGRGDAGVSLVELLVVTSLLALALALVFGSLMRAQAGRAKVDNMTAAASQGRLAFSRLDAQVRYATAINRPVRVGKDWYLEMATGPGGSSCSQWRLVDATDTLQYRSWTPSGSTASGLTPWQVAATGVVNAPSVAAEAPFTFLPADADLLRQQVEVHLLLRSGTGTDVGHGEVTTTLVARNTTTRTSTNADANGDGRSDVEVCRQVTRS